MDKMSFAVRIAIFGLAFGFGASALHVQAADPVLPKPQTIPYDIENDPRIDRREHPNAPHIVREPSPLDFEPQNGANVKDDPIFLSFAAWIQKYRLAMENKKPELVAEGLSLAKARRAALLELIKNNPQRALSWAISQENRAVLPVDILAQLETRVAGCGTYNVLITNTMAPTRNSQPNISVAPTNSNQTSNEPPKERMVSTIMRYSAINGKVFQVYVYGWRKSLTTKYNIPLQGIAVDNLLAIDVNPARVLEAGEKVPEGAKIGNPDKKCPLCGADFKENGGVVAQIGSIYYYFDSLAHLRQIAEKLIESEQVIGPEIGSSCDEPLSSVLDKIKNDELSKAGLGAGNNGVPTGNF